MSPGRQWSRVGHHLALWLVALLCLLATTTVRADRSPANCTGSGLGINLFTSIPDVHVGDTISYSINLFNGIVGSGRIVCDATEITAFIVTPDNVIHPINLSRTTLLNGQSDFYLDVVSYVVRAQDILPDGTLNATANTTGTIHQNEENSTGGGFQEVNTQVNLPCVLLTALCVGGVGENGMITISGTVTNCGNNTLVGVTVTNFHEGGNFTVVFPTNLAIGQTVNFTASYIPVNPCAPSTAVLTVRATDEFTATPRTITNFATVTCQNTLTPGIEVTKVCPVSPVSPGQLLTFSGTVRNTGNVTLTNVVVLNNQPSANTSVFTRATLAPGEIVNFTGSYIAPAACSVSDTLVATATSRCGTGVSSTASATCPILTAPAIVVTATCPVGPITGNSFTYTGTVRNSGNITLNNVVVTSDRPSANTTVFTIASLAPGATSAFSSTVNIPANACAVATTFSGRGTDSCTLNNVTNTVTTTCNITSSPAIAVTLDCPVAPATSGGPITYTGTVRNSGNVTLNNVFVVNNQPSANTPVIGPLTLLPGVTTSFTATFTSPADACSVSSTVTATGVDSCAGGTVSNTASATCPLLTSPAILLTQACPIGPVIPGQLLTYTGTIRNTGNVTLTNIVVLNNQSGSLVPVMVTNQVLTTNEVVTISPDAPSTLGLVGYWALNESSGTLAADTSGFSNNGLIANATHTPGQFGNGLGFNGVNAFVSIPSANSLNIVGPITMAAWVRPQFGVGIQDILSHGMQGTAPGDISIRINNGRYEVGGYDVLPKASAPVPVGDYGNFVHIAGVFNGSAWVIYRNGVALNTSANSIGAVQVNADWAIGARSGGVTRFFNGDIDEVRLYNRSLSATEVLALTSPGVVTTNFVVSTNFVVTTGTTGSTPIFTLASLAPGAVVSFTGSYPAPTECSSTSTSVVTATSVCGGSVTSTATTTCPIQTTPRIVVNQICPTTPVLPGGILTYSGSVSNAGNITLTNIIVVNNQPANGTVIFTAASLAPGASASFNGSYQVPTNCCVVSSTVRATGQGCVGETVSDTATRTCVVATSPQIVVTKVCAPGTLRPGDLLTYSGTVRNAGNITLINVTVVNNHPSANTPVLGPLTLAPGETVNYNVSYIIPADFCGTDTVTASGLDVCTFLPVVDSVTTTCPVVTAPGISVTKICPVVPTPRGSLYTFTGVVRNTGNVTLVNVYVTDNQPTNNTPVIGPITLAPGATFNFSGSYLVPPCDKDNCCFIIDTLTARGADRCSGSNVTSTATAVCPLLTQPALALVQTCPPAPLVMGSVYNYSGFVTNTGDIVLTNVFVFGPQGTNTVLVGPIELAPGEIEFYAGSYTVPFNVCAATVTARGQDTCGGTAATNSFSCPVATSPQIAVTASCPIIPVVPGGSLTYNGTVQNTGNITLTNVVVRSDRPVPNTTVFTLSSLAPGAIAAFSGTSTTPTNVCAVATTFQGTGQSICTLGSVTNSVTTTCTTTTTPALSLTQNCPPGPVTAGSLVLFNGVVSNSGDITLTNVYVFSSQPSTNPPVIGPITLVPGASAPYAGSYLASSGNNQVTNSVIVTNSVSTITTNSANVITTNVVVTVTTNTIAPAFGTIDPVSGAMVNRFNTESNLHGLMFADQDEQFGATLFYTTRHPATGPDQLVTISTPSGTITDRFALTAGITNIDALTFAAPDVGHGVINFYYIRHDTTNQSVFGQIIVQGASSSADFAPVLPNSGYRALAFAEPNLSTFGANLFHYIREDNTGLATMGTIYTDGAMVVTDRYTLGTGLNYDSLVYAPGTVSTWGTSIFAYLRHDAIGSIIGSIDPVTRIPTDRINLGTNRLSALTFTATDVGYGPNLFYYLLPERNILNTNSVTTFTTNLVVTMTTNTVTTFTTNNVVSFTPANTVTAVGKDICLARTASASANCQSALASVTPGMVVGPPTGNGSFGLSLPTEIGQSYTIQYKNSLSDPVWIDLETVTGTGGTLDIMDAAATSQPARFYRVIFTNQ